MTEFRMPSLGADMEAGTLVQWLKKPGDALKRGDIIAVVDTQKGAIEIEVYDDGVLERIAVEEGAKVPVGTVLAMIRGPGDEALAVAAAGPPRAERVSPAARKAASELHVDLSRVTPSGPGGSITRADVERAAQPKAAPIRSAIAAAMARSKREIPHLYLSSTIDMSAALTWLAARNQTRPVAERLLPVVLLLKAVAHACVEVPEANGYWTSGAFQAGTGIHIGCAIALRDGGLVAPALHDVERKDLDQLMRELSDLVSRTRAGTLKSSELADPTVTVTNLGDLGVETAFGVIYPPQVAIVAFGRILERACVVESRVEPRPTVVASVSADHRALDGRRAGRFLGAIDTWLQQPEAL